MAYIQYTNGAREFRSEAEAEKLWLIKVGRAAPQTPAQEAYVKQIRKRIKRVYLDYRTAPEAYIQAHLSEIVLRAISSWIVDRKGRPTRPATKEDLDFAIKYGLFARGKPTALVTGKGQLTLV